MNRVVNRMPALYLSHGAPPLADDALWPGQLAEWSADLPRPKAILMISAHWENAPLALGATETMPLVYDFWGFPEHYYEVTYAAPGAPELAESVRKLLRGPGIPVQDVPDRGSTTARTSRSSRCTRTPTSPSFRSPCRRSTRPGSWTSAAASRRCATRAC